MKLDNIFCFNICTYSGSINVCQHNEGATGKHLNNLDIFNLKYNAKSNPLSVCYLRTFKSIIDY